MRIQFDKTHQQEVIDDARQIGGRGGDFRAEEVAHLPGEHDADITCAQLTGQGTKERIETCRIGCQAAECAQAVDQHTLAALLLYKLQQARTDLVEQTLGRRLPA
ncbi:hypothetical protein D3C81_1752780 [compost metagenome]